MGKDGSVTEDLKEVIGVLKDLIPSIKDTSGATTRVYSDISNIKSSVDKLFEIVVTGNGRESLMAQITSIRERQLSLVGDIAEFTNGLGALNKSLEELRKEHEIEREMKSASKTTLIVAVISSIVGPILVAIITAILLKK